MKGCLATLTVLAALGVGGYLVYENPSLAAKATSAGRDAMTWVQGEVQRLQATATPAPAPSASPTVPGMPPPVIHLIVPSPSPPSPSLIRGVNGGGGAPVGPALWSPAACTWAIGTMTTDVYLDQAEVVAIENGTDTRYGNGREIIAYYQRYVSEWSTVLSEMQGWCQDSALPISGDQRTEAEGWFAAAIAVHQGDTRAHPEDAVWNRQWVLNYQRLTTLYAK